MHLNQTSVKSNHLRLEKCNQFLKIKFNDLVSAESQVIYSHERKRPHTMHVIKKVSYFLVWVLPVFLLLHNKVTVLPTWKWYPLWTRLRWKWWGKVEKDLSATLLCLSNRKAPSYQNLYLNVYMTHKKQVKIKIG